MAVTLGYKNIYREPKGFPEWQKRGMPIESLTAGEGSVPISQAPGPLHGWSMLWTFLGIFAGGIALNLTPCVYPLIPITVSFFGGQTAEKKPDQGKLLTHGLCYLLGLALTNSALGVVAALTGGLMGAALQNPIVLIFVSGILLFFATSLFGYWELRLPQALTRFSTKSHAGYFGSLFMGLTLGFVAAPCIGPFILGLLTWVASMGSPWLGFIVFFTLSLGLGLPLFVLAVFSGQLQRLPQAGDWMIWVRKCMGWVLVGMAANFIRPFMPESWGILILVGVVLSAGFHLGWIDKSQASSRLFPWLKTIVGIGCLVLATFWTTSWVLRGPGVTWKAYSEGALDDARALKKPVIIDFFATWCSPCREFEAVTFRDSDVVKLAQRDFLMIKVDVTRGGDPEKNRLLQRMGVKGVPTIVFLGRDGQERSDLRLVDFLPPDQFLSRMVELKDTTR